MKRNSLFIKMVLLSLLTITSVQAQLLDYYDFSSELYSEATQQDNFETSGFVDPVNSSRYGDEKFELAAWYGLTYGELENQNGIRRVDVKYAPNEGNLFYVFYDNALTLDNNNIALTERTSSLVGIGAKHDWSKEWFTKLEIGRRFLTTQEDQQLFNVENGYFFTKKVLGKLIVQYDIRQDDDLLTTGGFVDFELMRNVRLETGLFYAENLTIPDTNNQRFLVIPKLQLGTVEWVVAAYYDRYKTPDVEVNQFSGGYTLVAFPILTNLRGNLFFNYDKGFRNEITVVSVGVNQKI